MSFNIALTGLDAANDDLSVTSNNLANVATVGFKGSRTEFADLFASTQTGVSATAVGNGVAVSEVAQQFTQGNIETTGNNLDLAVSGNGFFITSNNGALNYTRDGSFQLNAQGQLVTSEGYAVQPAITIPTGAQTITIGSDGTVSVQLPNQTTPTTVGTLQLANFINPAGLQDIGGNLSVETAASGPPTVGTPGLSGLGTLIQGSVEASNVDIVEELVNMIQTQEAYEMNSRAVETTDQMLQYGTQNM